MSDRLEEIRTRPETVLPGLKEPIIWISASERDWLCSGKAAEADQGELRRQIMLELKASGHLKATAPIPPSATQEAQIAEVYEFWRAELYPQLSATPSKTRRAVILAALHSGYPVEQLKQIIRWAKQDPFCSGRDPKGDGRRWDDLFSIIGSQNKIDRNLLKAQRLGGAAGRAAGASLMPSKNAEARRL